MRDTIRGIIGKLRKGIDGYILVAVDAQDYTIHSWEVENYGEIPCIWEITPFYIVIGWYRNPIKMSVLRDQIERTIGGAKL